MSDIVNKSCRTCKHFNYGKCGLADQIFEFENIDILDVKISNGELEKLEEVLDGHLKPDETYGTPRNMNRIDRKKLVVDKIVRVIRNFATEDADFEIEAKIKDYNNFYCSKYE
jgi:hypothetical protein